MLDLRKKILDGDVPPDVLSAIATLTFPLPTDQVLSLFPAVYQKGDEGIREAISASFSSISSEVVEEFLIHTDETDVLSFYFDLLSDGWLENAEKYYLDILRNPVCNARILEKMATLSMDAILNYLLNNHSLLQVNPTVFNILKENDALSPAQSRRLQEYIKYGLVGKKTDKATENGVLPGTQEQVVDEDTTGLEEEISGEALAAYSELVAEESEDVLEATSNIEIEEDMDLNTYQKLLKMNVSQKIQCALKGNKEERSILIRDSNRTVALAVMQSPKLTEKEAEVISAMRNVHRDVLRTLASNRVFLKKYRAEIFVFSNNDKVFWGPWISREQNFCLNQTAWD